MTTLIAFVTAHYQDILNIAVATVGLARLIVKLTPTPKDDTFLASVIDWLSHLGLKL